MMSHSEEQAITDGVEEVRTMLKVDGVDLQVLEIDAAARRVRLRLDLSVVECIDCVVSPEMITSIISGAVRKRIRGGIDVIVEDPRVDA
jgi:Fe-S cluster biogenesis protein NfuA